jgi:hypothetical protein
MASSTDAHFVDRELWGAYLRTRRNDAACNQLYIIGTGFDLRSRGAAQLVRPVSLVSHVPAVPSSHADDCATEHEPRRRTQALLRGRAQRKIDTAARSAIADRCDPGFKRTPCVSRGAQDRHCIRIGCSLRSRVGCTVSPQSSLHR